MQVKISNKGFSAIGVVIIVVVIAVISLVGWRVLANKDDNKTTNYNSPNNQQANNTPKQETDPYAGWQTYCDTENAKGCFKYPSDWVTSQYGGFENSTQTAYIDFKGYNNKDQAADSVYVVKVVDLANKELGLKIVGSVYNNVPSYSIFNASDVSALKAGENSQLVTVNPEFQRNPGEDMSFMATPGVAGLKAITNLEQAKNWFNTPEAQTCLKVLQSFYYQ